MGQAGRQRPEELRRRDGEMKDVVSREVGGSEWVEAWIEAINDDPEIARLGKWFNGTMRIDIGSERYILTVFRGRVEGLLVNPIWDKPYDFKIAAPLEVWKESAQPVPRPFYQDIFGMMWNHGMTLEGNVVMAMQQIRTVKLMLGQMKQVS